MVAFKPAQDDTITRRPTGVTGWRRGRVSWARTYSALGVPPRAARRARLDAVPPLASRQVVAHDTTRQNVPTHRILDAGDEEYGYIVHPTL